MKKSLILFGLLVLLVGCGQKDDSLVNVEKVDKVKENRPHLSSDKPKKDQAEKQKEANIKHDRSKEEANIKHDRLKAKSKEKVETKKKPSKNEKTGEESLDLSPNSPVKKESEKHTKNKKPKSGETTNQHIKTPQQSQAKKESKKETTQAKTKDKVEYKTIQEKKILPFSVDEGYNDQMIKGKRQVLYEGENGYEIIEHRDKYVNGKKTGRESKVIQTFYPVDAVIIIGSGRELGIQEDLSKEVFHILNRYRQDQGLPILQWDPLFYKAAQVRAKELSSLYSHTRPDGREWDEVFEDLNSKAYATSENIAKGFPTASDVMDGWKGSLEHNANMLGSNHSKVGIAAYVDEAHYYHWVQIFGN